MKMKERDNNLAEYDWLNWCMPIYDVLKKHYSNSKLWSRIKIKYEFFTTK